MLCACRGSLLYSPSGPHSHMLSFVPGHFSDYSPPLREGASHPEHSQDPEQTNLVNSEMLQVIDIILATLYFVITLVFRCATEFAPDPRDDTLQALDMELVSHPEQSQDLGETHITGVQQVVITAIRALEIETSPLHPAGKTDASDPGQERPAASMLPLSPDQLVDQVEWCSRRDDPRALDEVISRHYDALRHYSVMHPCRGQLLDHLSVMLITRFERRGNGKDLDQVITFQSEVLALRPVGHPDRSLSLNNLANKLSTRFDHRGNDEDLDQAIALHREVLALRPVGHTDRPPSLNTLGNQLSARFSHRGNVEDLAEAIVLHRQAVALCSVGHTDRSSSMNNLAVQLSARFDHGGNTEDLDEAIALDREALASHPVVHTDRFSTLNNLGEQLSTRFGHRGHVEDLNESREVLHRSLSLLEQHDPRQLAAHMALATVYLLFHQSRLDGTDARKDSDSLNAVMDHLKAAAQVVSGSLLRRLRASLRWVHHASQYSHGTELEAYVTSMQLLNAYVSVSASVSSRHDAMKEKELPRALAVDAASRALRNGDVGRAVELLEQGRAVIWTQITRLRTPLGSLQTRGDHAVTLMQRFRDLSSLLNKPPASHPEGNVEAEATRYRRLVEDWDGVVGEIRKIEGFSRFLLPPLFSELRDAARNGPIIVLIASMSSCDAIIVTHRQPPTSIRLPTNFRKLGRLVLALQEAITKEASPKGHQPALTNVLRELWDKIVRPVVRNLDRFAPRRSRIWWCPTSLFNFLPLHAAGEYRKGGQLLSQLYISSYTPSLTALMTARRGHDRARRCCEGAPPVPFAAIGQNRPAGHSSTLENVEPELELVEKLLPPPPTVSFTKISSADATQSRALHALRENTWLHFACHGTQKFDEPFNSAFLMRDQPLSLLDIAQTDLSRHEFAFLAACETAVGDFDTPDEVVHLAAGLQFAGVKSVVGTLWKVNDGTVQRLVEAFYKNFCRDGAMDSTRAAEALHQAVRSLACDKGIPLDQRIVFIHIGV
ncbi:CHAT domain-containing protein [Suillus occidentalis]|nr:CHAT domain-containing protein [Suillus occidentalis]